MTSLIVALREMAAGLLHADDVEVKPVVVLLA